MIEPSWRSAPRVRPFLVFLVLGTAVQGQPAAAQTSLPASIDRDAVWSGTIEIKSEVVIRNATVRVEPGSTIRFLTLGRPEGASIRFGRGLAGEQLLGRSRLILSGTADRPITVETPEGGPPGFITSDLASGCSLVARHVIFRRLGSAVVGKQGVPAVLVVLSSAEDDLWMADCRFSDCGRVHTEFIGTGASAEISGCTFARTLGGTAIEFIGTSDGLRVVSNNVADAAFRLECSQLLLKDNVLAGEQASITLPARNGRGITISGNYVHCATNLDQGFYALRCASPEAVVADNVLLGGTYVIEQAPRTVTGNVLVGAAGLRPSADISGRTGNGATTTTHFLLSNPAPRATITDNLFLGPAYAAVSAGRESLQPHIEHNLFDGWGVARRAIHFNMLLAASRDKPLAAIVTGNVLARYRSAPIVDGAKQVGTVAHAGLNVFAEVPDVLYETIDVQKAAPGDRALRSFAELRLHAPVATRSALSAESQLLQRQIRVAEVRAMWFDAYRPLQGSPLVGSQPAGPRPASSPG